MDKLRILVIDDTEKNLETARKQFAEHDVTTVASFTEAHVLLGNNNRTDDTGPDKKPYVRWNEGLPNFDVVLTDLFMTAVPDGGNTDKAGQDTTYGLVLALAAIRRGVKMVAIVTRGSHHNEPILWALDLLELEFTEDVRVYMIGNTAFACCNDTERENGKDWASVLKKLQKLKV